jgi:hypothetical protein
VALGLSEVRKSESKTLKWLLEKFLAWKAQKSHEKLGGSAMTEQEVVAPRARGMLQATRHGINTCVVSKGLFCHPPPFFAMHHSTLVTDQQDRLLRSLREKGSFFFLLHEKSLLPIPVLTY